jgi:hypothetical protein
MINSPYEQALLRQERALQEENIVNDTNYMIYIPEVQSYLRSEEGQLPRVVGTTRVIKNALLALLRGHVIDVDYGRNYMDSSNTGERYIRNLRIFEDNFCSDHKSYNFIPMRQGRYYMALQYRIKPNRIHQVDYSTNPYENFGAIQVVYHLLQGRTIIPATDHKINIPVRLNTTMNHISLLRDEGHPIFNDKAYPLYVSNTYKWRMYNG